MRKSIIFGALGVAVSVAAPVQAADTLRVATFLPERSMNVTFALKPFMDGVSKDVGDKITMQGYWGGSLGRNPRKQLELVLDGIADVTVVTPGYNPGRYPEMGAFELPYLFLTGKEASTVMWKMFEKGKITGYEEVKALGLFTTDIYGVHTKREIKSLADLKGLKIRAAGPVQSDALKLYGAIPIGMPVNQVTESLSRGVVDGVLLGYAGLTVFRAQTITKYHIDVPLGTAPLSVVMNKEKFEKQPKDVQAAIDKYSGLAMAERAGGGFDKMSGIFRGKIVKEGGHTLSKYDPSNLAGDLKSAKSVHDAWIAKTKNGQAFYDELLKTIGEVRG